MSQTSYSIDSAPALAGMIADTRNKHVESCVAYEALVPGRFVVLDAGGKVRYPNDTDDAENIYGVVLYQDLLVAGGYAADAQVPVMRVGCVWVEFDGGTWAANAAVNVHCDDSGAPTKLGKATASAASADVIVASPEGVKFDRKAGTATLKRVVLNLPA